MSNDSRISAASIILMAKDIYILRIDINIEI